MAEGDADTGEPLPDIDRALVEGKTALPSARAGAVSRRALIDRARQSGRRIVAVTAAAGYGKSTMLAEWATLEDRAVCWASIDRFDDDPAALLSLLAAATTAVAPGGQDVASQMRGVGTAALARSAPLLARSWAAAVAPFVLFIDDLHLASSPHCLDVLEIALAGIPEGSQVVVASRQDQDHLARLRVEGAVYDISAVDLRMDADGARRIFAAAEVAASDDAVLSAVERCEGWPTGVFLCALAAADGADLEIVGDDRLVADYLYRECLAGLAPELQEFLRQTAILDQLSAPLCDAVRDADDSHEMLRLVDALNLFLIPLDRRRQWFRYHSLFREFLLGELAGSDPKLIPVLHLRAADWFTGQDAPRRAVEHLLAAGDRERSPGLVARLAMPTYQTGQVAVVSRWLAQLGDATVGDHPALAVVAAWRAILLGESPAAEHWAEALERLELPEGPPEARVEFEAARAGVRAVLCAEGPERMLADAQLAVDNQPEWDPWRTTAIYLTGMAQLLLGDRARARRTLTDSIGAALRLGNTNVLVLANAELAILALERDEWADARRHAWSAMRVVDDKSMDGYPTTALAFAVAARVALREGDAGAAARHLARGMRARVQCTHVLPYLAVRARLQLAMCHSALGDAPAAAQLVDEIDALLRLRPRLGVLAEQTEVFRETLARHPASSAAAPLTPAELRVLPYLQTHLTIGEIGQRLYVSRNTVSTHVTSIYRKLAVTTRGAAVERALETGLLGA